jgi:adenosylmethionine-8-amino-7-oxononanoate aminotransferase
MNPAVAATDIDELVRQDRMHLLHPQHYAPDHQNPVILERGEGVWLFDVRGRRYLDGLASLWNVAVGHGRRELADAAAEQLGRLAFTTAYTGFTNAPAIQLARAVLDRCYDNMGGLFFTNSGAESNEGAFKTARFYWNLRGQPSKVKLIARERAYHGATLATCAMTGLPAFWKYFGPLPAEIVRATKPASLDCACTPNADGECACWIEQAIEREGADTVAAVICEPVKGAGGVWTPAPDYFTKVRAICDRHEVLLIADEVITGFGRTGEWFALQNWGVNPDILSISKAITSAYIPLGAFVVSQEIMDALQDLPPDARFMHAATNSGHPGACAVGLRNLQIFEDEGLVENARRMGEHLAGGLESALGAHPHVANIRHLGLMAGITLMRDAGGKQGYAPAEMMGARAARHLREEGGVITRFIGDNIAFAPPLTITKAEVDFLLDAVEKAVGAVC